MKNYQTKPREIEQIEARQWNPDEPKDANNFIEWLQGKGYKVEITTEYHEVALNVTVMNSEMYVEPSTWVYFRGKSIHNCSNRTFQEVFEPIE